MRRRNRSEVSIFSLSFLDLLFCGLAGVVLLWVLIEPPLAAEKQTQFQFISVRQYGKWHLQSMRLMVSE